MVSLISSVKMKTAYTYIATKNAELVIRSVQIEESGGTAISFAADVSCEADVESMMRAVS